MSNKAKTVAAIALGLILLACLGIAGGVYMIMYGYPALSNEWFDTPDELDHATKISYRRLMIGKVDHGRQFLLMSDADRGSPDKDFTRLATTYFHRNGPVGRALERYNWFPGPENTYWADARMPASLLGMIATPGGLPLTPLIGLWSEPPLAKILIGDGCIASYARPYQFVDFYERNHAFIDLSAPAGNAKAKFTFIQDAVGRGANIRVIEGPERKTLTEQGPRNFYKVIVLDTIRGRTDLVAQELMTKEAMKLLFEALTEDGVLLMHTSNRNYDLVSPIADVAQSLGFQCLHAHDGLAAPPAPPPKFAVAAKSMGHYTSEWMLIARGPEPLAAVEARRLNQGPNQGIQWRTIKGSGKHVWVDDAGNSLWPLRR